MNRRADRSLKKQLVTLILTAASLATTLLLGVPAVQNQTLPSYCGSYPPAPAPDQWESNYVFYSEGRLAYVSDDEGNRIPDYSYAGYRYGESPIPTVPQALRITPVSGDNTSRIQQALDQVGARTPDENGIRGAVVLAPGTYEIRGTLRVNRSGVVLRGDGDGSDPSTDTILRATGDTPHQRPVITLGSGSSSWTESSTRANITTPFVQVGSRSFSVDDTSAFNEGDYIVVHHPSTQAWIDAVDGGGVVNDARWRAGQIDIVYYRQIKQISGDTITLDAPVYNHLDLSLSQSYIAKVSSNRITQAGVESLRIDIVTAGGEDENHAWNGVQVVGAHDSWVRRVTALHFGYAGVRLEGAVRVTVENCRALDPVAIRTGGRMYNFSSDRRTQLVLFSRCEATNGRHGYISNGVSLTSGLVYYRCRATRGGGSEGGHRMWTTGVLYDNITETNQGQVLLINRGDAGTSHGWGAAHSTIWKYNSELVVQKPPTAQNYGITNVGRFRPTFYAPGPPGVQELRSGTLVPDSLYEAQLCERLGGTEPPAAYEAEASDNTFSGSTVVSSCSTCSGGAKVRFIGNNPSNFVTINNVNAGTGGTRTLTIYYLLNGARSFFVSVNGGEAIQVPVTGTSWSIPASTTITVLVNAGNNSIRFFNNSAYAPDLDRIVVSP